MERLEFIRKAVAEKIIIEIPENLKGKDLKITVTEATDEISQLPVNKRANDIMKYYGTANYPDIDLDKFNVYEQ
jgi:hypothetical protein